MVRAIPSQETAPSLNEFKSAPADLGPGLPTILPQWAASFSIRTTMKIEVGRTAPAPYGD
jgi:hypothetical protein